MSWILRAEKNIFDKVTDVYMIEKGNWTVDLDQAKRFDTEASASHCRMMCHKFFSNIELIQIDV